MLVGLDNKCQVADFYFPYVGESNHVSGASGSYLHRVGVWVDGKLSWLSDETWKISVFTNNVTGAGEWTAENLELKVVLTGSDVVHNEHNVFLRHFTIFNKGTKKRTIKLFLAQQFRIYESRRGDTGFFDPDNHAVIHYKGDIAFLVNAFADQGKKFDQYNIGLFGIEGKEGTYVDAEDGNLESNSIEHGSVDSIIGLDFVLKNNEAGETFYWVACARSVESVNRLNKLVLDEGPDRLIFSTKAYWQAWLHKDNKMEEDLSLLGEKLRNLYQRSLLVMRMHADNRGGVIASSDTDILHHGRDTYSYVWPRDGAIIANAFDRAGYGGVAARFYRFMSGLLSEDGYLMHKYRSDGCLGSSWHSWVSMTGKKQLPIQEDETAVTLFMLWEHYKKYHDIELIESIYNSFIEPSAHFMCRHIGRFDLPMPSFDLWEEKYGISTYTSASVYGGLSAAAKFAGLLGKVEDANYYQNVADRVKDSIKSVLFDKKEKIFVKQIYFDDDTDEVCYDKVLDVSSLFGLIMFNVFSVEDSDVKDMIVAVENNLRPQNDQLGFVRYKGDLYYHRYDTESANPWIITTLWMARLYIKRAKTLKDLKLAEDILNWTAGHANLGGLLAEQMHPVTREQLSTTPLVWSHAEFVLTILDYIDKFKMLSKKK